MVKCNGRLRCSGGRIPGIIPSNSSATDCELSQYCEGYSGSMRSGTLKCSKLKKFTLCFGVSMTWADKHVQVEVSPLFYLCITPIFPPESAQWVAKRYKW